MMGASAESLPGPYAERLLALAVSPHLIVAALVAAAATLTATAPSDLALWLVLVAGAAGWSSAWSP
jgi:hypothetical protein